MTHGEACEQLLDAARQFTAGDLTRQEWNDRVDDILLTRYPGDPDLLRRRHRGLYALSPAARTSTPSGTRPLAAA